MRAVDIAFEQRHFDSGPTIADETYNPGRRKFYVYNTLKEMEARGIDTELVPCFVSHTFLREFGTRYQIVYPDAAVRSDKLMRAIYAPSGVRAGHHGGECVELLMEACNCLVANGAQITVSGLTEVPVLIDSLRRLLPVPVVDSNLVYAEYSLGCDAALPVREFKLGVVGGVGPAATVDFMQKVVRLTGAARDQDHIKMMVEQNPQIPDRTANLIGSGADPTISLLATRKQLEAGGANAVAIPCNTAHAFVDRIQPYLGIPIVNMLSEVVRHIRSQSPGLGRVGLLATSGTVASGVYHEVAAAAGLELLVPEEAFQDLIMQAIYGERGVKGGFTSGPCSDHPVTAIGHLAAHGAEAIILGCTELPLIAIDVAMGQSIALLYPTEILAARCVALARASAAKPRLDSGISSSLA